MMRRRLKAFINTQITGRSEILYRYRRWWPWLALALYFALISLSSLLLMRHVERQDRLALEMETAEIGAAIEQRMNTTEALLRSAANGFSFVPRINGDFFYSFIKGLRLDQEAFGIVGIGWTVPVMRDQIAEFEAIVRAGGQEDFFIWPVTDERLNYAIVHLAPDNAVNRAALGFNMFSEPARRLAMIQAFDTGAPRASAPVVLKQEGPADEKTGFLVYAPVFDGSRRRLNEAPDRDRFRGFVYAAVRGADLIRAVISARDTDRLDLELYDVTDASRQLIYDSHPEIWSDGDSHKIATQLTVGGRKLELVVTPVYANEFRDTAQRIMVYALLLTGILTSLLLASLMWLVVRSMERSRRALDRQIEQLEIRSILLRELNHRVKNTLATVHSLAALSRQGATDVNSYFATLSGRLRALSATHDLLTQSDWGATELQDIAEAELSPFRGGLGQVLIKGPRVMFDPTKALSLGLSFHELATNASKYGALSSTSGRVTLFWYMEDETTLFIRWTETGGPAVAENRHQGFGSTLIQKLMARQLKADVSLRFEPAGAVCEFRIAIDPAEESETSLLRFRRKRGTGSKPAGKR